MEYLRYDRPPAVDLHQRMKIGERQPMPVLQHDTHRRSRADRFQDVHFGFRPGIGSELSDGGIEIFDASGLLLHAG